MHLVLSLFEHALCVVERLKLLDDNMAGSEWKVVPLANHRQKLQRATHQDRSNGGGQRIELRFQLFFAAAPLSYLLSRARLAFSGLNNVEIRNPYFWTSDMAESDVAFTFLSPAPMADLFTKLPQ